MAVSVWFSASLARSFSVGAAYLPLTSMRFVIISK